MGIMRTSIFSTVLALAISLAIPSFADTTILLTRHGDRDPLAEELTDAGRARALALVDAVAEFDIVAIYSPDKKRNLDTAAPLAAKLGLSVTILPEFEATPSLRDDHLGQTVIWIGNTDNLVKIYEQLGGTGAPPEFYGDLYILTLVEGRKPVVEIRHYGE
jgi:hypothetical protein